MNTNIGIFVHYNGCVYTVAGRIVTKDPSDVDACVERLLHAGNIEPDKIRVIYTGQNEFAILIQSSVYSICYSSIISSYQENINKEDE